MNYIYQFRASFLYIPNKKSNILKKKYLCFTKFAIKLFVPELVDWWSGLLFPEYCAETQG